jgi:hypothetical protein
MGLVGFAVFAIMWGPFPVWLYRHTGTGPEAKPNAITDYRTALDARRTHHQTGLATSVPFVEMRHDGSTRCP